MPKQIRHSLLVALMLGFISASALNSLAVPPPPDPAAPQAAAAQGSRGRALPWLGLLVSARWMG